MLLLILRLSSSCEGVPRVAVFAYSKARGDPWSVQIVDRGPCRTRLWCFWTAVLPSLARRRALGLLDCCFFQQRVELLVDPLSFRSFGLWTAAEEQGRNSQVLGGPTEDLWSPRGFLVVEDAPLDTASSSLRRPASSVSEGRPLFVNRELEFVQLLHPIMDVSGRGAEGGERRGRGA